MYIFVFNYPDRQTTLTSKGEKNKKKLERKNKSSMENLNTGRAHFYSTESFVIRKIRQFFQ